MSASEFLSDPVLDLRKESHRLASVVVGEITIPNSVS
jgi:hypothetical protein